MHPPTLFPYSRCPHRQYGFGLASVMLAIALSTLLATLASAELARRVNDAAAQATGRYLLTVREALIAFQLRHEAWLSGVDTSSPELYPAPPALTWEAAANGMQVAHGSIALLQNEGLLPPGLPGFTPLGERAQFVLLRPSHCIDTSCPLQSYVYTCHPISSQTSTKAQGSCQAAQGRHAEYDAALLGQVMLSTEGYGMHDALTKGHFSGALAQVDKAWFPISEHQGHAAVVGTLGLTPFGQFVRMGDTRPVQLLDTLSVRGAIRTDTGLLLDTQVSPGSPCPVAHMFAATTAGELAVCRNGVWSPSNGKAVQSVLSDLIHGAYVAPPTCQPPASPYRYVALSASDVIVSGAQLDVHGNVHGQVSGSGNVNAVGNVALTGSFSGSFQSAPSSSLRVHQSVTLDAAHRIQISPPGANARASVIQGCMS